MRDDWDEPEESSRAKRIWGFVGIGVICAALLAGAIWLTLKVTNAPVPAAQVNVPSLSGLTVTQALDKLKEANLAPGTQTPVESSNENKDKVVDQNPSEGTLVNEGTQVNIQVGKGVTAVQVPVLSAMTEQQAADALDKVGLKMKKTTESSEEAYRDRVTKQDPAEGAEVKPGSTVTVTFGTGPEMVAIPDGIVGMQLDAAKQALEDAGLNSTDQSAKSDKPKEQVLAMTRFDNGQPANPGDKVQKGFTVNLSWSDSSQFTLPNITQQKPEDAVKALNNAGWAGDLSTLQSGATEVETSEPTQIGLVLGQAPAANSVIDKTAKISIQIGVIKKIYLPSLIGLSYDEAVGQLQNLGWRGSLQTGGDVPNPPKGQGRTVAVQNPGPGEQITILDSVAIQLYAAEPPPPPPPPTTSPAGPTTSATTAPVTTVPVTTVPPTTRRRGRGNG